MPTKEFTIKKGETVDLGSGIQMKFIGTSHKETEGPSESSEIIQVEYQRGDEVEEDYVSVSHSSEGQTWQWQGFSFELLDHVYDEWIKLKVDVS